MTKMIRFSNFAQAILFKTELLGQISDGYWENSTPRDHYKVFNEVTVTHAFDAGSNGAVIGKNFHTRRSYNFANSMLLKCVGDRMIAAVRFFSAFPNTDLDNRWDYPESLDLESVNRWAEEVFNPGTIKHYINRSSRIKANFPDVNNSQELSDIVMSGISKVEYNMKQMKKDLKEMSALVNL